ncbi:MAG: nitrile hydratase subunit beta [Rubrivivax sp.]|jgi:nitrile hydratase|nr:nitrile hydratase subunit beta [Betaproteobacteria bacterium]MBP6317389.1 nitrile hydratase subunit beta [Rubrivivax sp.]MBK7458495.1 nitrile hydratase subunit beta [Betaproteobacteria bacterium]MBK7517094.1 nitrile hydratase subunit beta [Betaproteobacteria bacterium]MBK8106785.1 nitrile hydratase subunit beta [Betaproteobacteria bacterium]
MTYLSHADLGGQPGHGRVVPEAVGELFHAGWEPRALALTLAMGAAGAWNIDMSRAARETLPDYAQLSYYEIWIHALEELLLERGLLQPGELEAGATNAGPWLKLPRTLHAEDVATVLARGAPTARPGPASAFALGDAVRLRSGAVPHHTRLPGYARGKRGTIAAVHGPHVFADAHAQGLGEQPCPLYTVAFSGRELWGSEPGAARLTVSIDAWEPYLERAS